MRPTKAPPQSRLSPYARPLPTMGRRMTPQDRESLEMIQSPVSSKGGVRYVTVAIPANLQPTAENMARFFNPSKASESPMTVMTNGSNSIAPTSRSNRPQSPYGFVPISNESPHGSRPFSPSLSPFDYSHGSPSPSMMSTMTTETFTSSKGLDRLSPAFFPSVYRPSTPQDAAGAAARPFPKSPSVYRPSTPQDSAGAGGRPKTPTGRKSPFVKNNTTDDDSVQKKRIKTEMCMNYTNNRPCPFGAHCTYAHGEEELQMTKLLDLHKAGLIDVDTYRTKPCLTWVTTGSCPFGKRCCGIHDPRVSGSNPSWLPHTETQGNTMTTDINVDCLHQKRLHSILYGNPFGNQFSFNNSSGDWSDIYRLICRIDYSKDLEGGWIDKRRRGGFSPISKLQIALKLRGQADWQYKYRPQHIVHDELCMVLQKRAFRLGTNDSMEAQEISLSAYNPRIASHVLVREIAFGPDSDPTARGVSLWFNIAEDEVEICTPHQAKRFRWKRGLKTNKDQENDTKDSSVFETLDSFPMIRPDDKDAFDLATDIMKHRCAVLQTERLSSMRDRFEALKKLETQKKALQERFENQKQSWATWAWPVNVGRGKVNKNTPVPPVDGKYSLEQKVKKDTPKDEDAEDEPCIGSAVIGIWESFLSVQSGGSSVSRSFGESRSGRRLPVFEKLSQGEHLDADRGLPHIKHRAVPQDGMGRPHGRQQERCWKALLLGSDSAHESNEWDLVREHFEHSRSKKVLSIIQSPA